MRERKRTVNDLKPLETMGRLEYVVLKARLHEHPRN